MKRAIYAGESGDSDINICMVDTWKTGLSGTTSFYNAATLLEIYQVSSEGKLEHQEYPPLRNKDIPLSSNRISPTDHTKLFTTRRNAT
jgi:hypothetical protein